MPSDIPGGDPRPGTVADAGRRVRAAADAELVARIRAGDEAAFETIFRTYLAPLSTFAYRYVGSRDLAADLVQDLFLWIWRNRGGWTVQGSLKAYLYSAVRNRGLDVIRHRRIEHRWAEESARERRASWATAAASSGEADDERLAALERAIAALPDRRRQVFLLRWRDRLSYAEIAEVMGTSLKTVENQMTRALQAVRRHARGDARGGFPPAASS